MRDSNSNPTPPPPNPEPENDLLDLSFAPDWARESPRVQAPRKPLDWRQDGGDQGRRSHSRERYPDQDRPRPRRPRQDDHRPRRDARAADGPPPPREHQERFDRHPAQPTESQAPRPPPRTFRERPYAGSREPQRPPPPPPPDLPLELRFLPDQTALSAIVRRVAGTYKAFPLRDIAHLFTGKPDSCRVKISLISEPPADSRPKPNDAPHAAEAVPTPPARPETTLSRESITALFQCQICGAPALERETLEAHIVDAHIEEFFEPEDIETPQPNGHFTCVQRCGLSNELLGPPNYHGTQERIAELLRTRYSGMPEADYRARLITLHDDESIEAWKQQNRTQRVFRPRQAATPASESVPPANTEPEGTDADLTPTDAESAPPSPPAAPAVNRQTAEFLLRRDFAANQIRESRQLHCPVSVALKSPSESLRSFIQNAWNHEHHRPYNICFALRGAFRAKRMHLVKVNTPSGPEFVHSRALDPLNAEHSVEEIRQLMAQIADHPGCTLRDLVEKFGATFTQGPEHLATQVTWLAEKGHILEFFNGELALAERHPKFRFPGG